jgi:hypothetical protein
MFKNGKGMALCVLCMMLCVLGMILVAARCCRDRPREVFLPAKAPEALSWEQQINELREQKWAADKSVEDYRKTALFFRDLFEEGQKEFHQKICQLECENERLQGEISALRSRLNEIGFSLD